MAQSGKGGCLGAFWGCLTAVVLLAVVAAGLAWYFVPRLLKDADKNLVPWLESKGRVLMGRFALDPLQVVITESDLTGREKDIWRAYLDARWKDAESSHDAALSREGLINQARTVVFSLPGTYYALRSINRQNLTMLSFSTADADRARDLVDDMIAGLEQGRYPADALSPLTNNICSVVSRVQISSNDEQGRFVKNRNYREFYRALAAIHAAPRAQPAATPIDLPEALRDELKAFRAAVEERMTSGQSQAVEKATASPSP